MWGAISDERTGLSFTIAPGPRQCSHFRVPVPWDSCIPRICLRGKVFIEPLPSSGFVCHIILFRDAKESGVWLKAL
jgi:hypothetical protein